MNFSEAPTGKLPYLEVDGKPLPESGAICRFLAAKYGLVAKDAWENAQMESQIETFRDFMTDVRPYFLVALGRAEGNKDELYKTVYLPAAEKIYPRLVNVISKSKSGFLANGGLTWGDFALAEALLTFGNYDPSFAKNYPKLVEYQKKVHAVPQIQKYMKTRKALDF